MVVMILFQTNDESTTHPVCSSRSETTELSINIEDATNMTGLPILFLRQVWSKAEELLMEKKVLSAPCSTSQARIVESKSMQRHHFVVLQNMTSLCLNVMTVVLGLFKGTYVHTLLQQLKITNCCEFISIILVNL